MTLDPSCISHMYLYISYVAVLYYVFTGKGEQVSIGWYVHIFILPVVSYPIEFSMPRDCKQNVLFLNLGS